MVCNTTPCCIKKGHLWHSQCCHRPLHPNSILCTAIGEGASTKYYQPARILMEPGVSLSLITAQLVARLQAEKIPYHFVLSALGCGMTSLHYVEVTLLSAMRMIQFLSDATSLIGYTNKRHSRHPTDVSSSGQRPAGRSRPWRSRPHRRPPRNWRLQ